MRVAVRADVFHRALKSTVFAASRDFDPRRPAFSGVLLDVSPTAFRVVATDGYRLALFESGDGYNCLEPLTAILLASDLAGLKLSRASGDTIRIAVNAAEAVIQSEKAAFNVPVIQARFPNYLAVFPNPKEQGVINLYCEKAAFVKTLMEARQKTTRKNRNVFFWARSEYIFLAAENAGTILPEKVAARCDHSTLFGVFNSDYLRDAVQALPAGDIKIRFVLPEAGRPVSSATELSPADQSHNVIRQLVMPCWRPFVYALPGFDS
jgi:DNA polymerase III sliding clamp (beta) subunit (PCNA family)